MGCTESKLDKEDTVRRCKERRRLMKQSVHARHHLAAAHSDYCRALRSTGAALVAFSSGEHLSVSDETAAVLLRPPPPSTTFTPPPPKHYNYTPSSKPPLANPHRYIYTPSTSNLSTIHPPPPPPPASTPSSRRHRRQPPPPPRRRIPMQVPHILSESSFSSSPKTFTYKARANSNYNNTPSQASSVWNWDDFYPPPSPPDSEQFQKLIENKKTGTQMHNEKSDPQDIKQMNERESNYSSYSHFSNKVSVKNYTRQGSMPVSNREHWESEEEVHCSEWEDHDHYSITSSSSDDEDLKSKSNFHSVKKGADDVKLHIDSKKFASRLNKISLEDERRIVVRHKDFSKIVADIKEYFDKAASGGEKVSDMIEIDQSFKQLRMTVIPSNGMLSILSSNWTSKTPLAVKYRIEPNSVEKPKSLCSTLDRLFAWEKKLYQEVKAREGVKFEHEKKLSVLKGQEYRGEDEAKLERTNASIKRLQSLILVTSEAASTTSSAIIDLRDSELVPQLVELCHGFMYMWRSMRQYHELQHHIVQQVRGLINLSTKFEPTSDLHHQSTRDLESALATWHSSFCRLITFQRDLIRSLNAWFKLTLLPTAAAATQPTFQNLPEPSEASAFCEEWKIALDRVPDTVSSESIKSFINVINSISLKQTEEIKIKKRADNASRELEKKANSLRKNEKKYYNSYSTVGIGIPEDGPALDMRDPLFEKKAEVANCKKRVEEEMVKHSKAVEVTRAMTLNNIQTGLPGVFQAMTSFSAIITEALETVCTSSYEIK